jgi:hypothetical protein
MDAATIKKLVGEMQNRWTELENLMQIKSEVEALLKSDKGYSPFGCWWADVGKVRNINLDLSIQPAYDFAKVLFVRNVYLPTIEKQIKLHKRRLGFFSREFKALSKLKSEVKGE